MEAHLGDSVPELDSGASGGFMIRPTCRRLAEVDFPIAEVSRYAALEQVLGTGGAGAGALEGAARLTALFLWTLQSSRTGNGAGQNNGGENEGVCGRGS